MIKTSSKKIFAGTFATEVSLFAKQGKEGMYAFLDINNGDDVIMYIWDKSNNHWVNSTTPTDNSVVSDTSSNFTANNPILSSGQRGYETDTKKEKVGDGTTAWSVLKYTPIITEGELNTITFENPLNTIHGTFDSPISGELVIDDTDAINGSVVTVIWTGNSNPTIVGINNIYMQGDITEAGIYVIYFNFLYGRVNVSIYNGELINPQPSQEIEPPFTLYEMTKSDSDFLTTSSTSWVGRGIADANPLTNDGYVVSNINSLGADGYLMLKLRDTNSNDGYIEAGGVCVFIINAVYYTLITGESGISSTKSVQIGDRMRIKREGNNVKAEYYRSGAWVLIRDFGNATPVSTGNAYFQIFAYKNNENSTVNSPKIYQ